MTLERFQQMIATGKPLAGEEMITFMREQSDATRRLLFDLNGSYHSPEEIVALFSRITDNKVDDSFRLFPPFYTDFGKNIHLGKNVFINSCCQFQDQGGIFIGDGTPPTMARAGTSLFTTAPAATMAWSPMVTPAKMVACAPIHTPFPIWMGE